MAGTGLYFGCFIRVLAAGTTTPSTPVQQILDPPSLLQQLWAGSFSYDSSTPTGMLLAYFSASSIFLIEAALGVCVLWVIFSGFQIMYSGGGEKLAEAKQHLTWAIGGVLVLLFSSLILRTLNSIFYT